MSTTQTNKAIAALVVISLLTLAPFLNRAFHIDEHVEVYVGKSLAQDFLRGLDVSLYYEGEERNMFLCLPNPPLTYYRMAVLVWSGLTKEWQLRLSLIPLILLSTFSMYYLASRFTKSPLLATLIFIGTPAFMLLSHNVTHDLPGISFFMGSIAFYIGGSERNDRRLIVGSGILLGLSLLSQYQSGLAIPIILAYELLRRRNVKNAVMASAVGIAVLMVWEVYSKVTYGSFLLLRAREAWFGGGDAYHPYSLSVAVDKTVANLLDMGGGIVVVPVLVLIAMYRSRGALWSLVLGAVGGYALVRWRYGYYLDGSRLLPFILFFGSACALAQILWGNLRNNLKAESAEESRSTDLFLMLWIAPSFVASTLLLPFGSVRYMAILVPASILAVIRAMERLAPRWRWAPREAVLPVAACLALLYGLAAAYADAQFADTYRKYAKHVAGRYGNEPGQVWYVGEDGFRDYMDAEGFRYLPSSGPELKIGDYVVIPRILHQYPLTPEVWDRLQRVDQTEYQTRFPLRTISSGAGAGFYCHLSGMLPVGITRAPIEVFTEYRVVQ